MTRQVPKNRLLPIFSITLLNEIAINVGVPVLTFLCFDVNSSLFASSANNTVRSFWFGLLSALPNCIALIVSPLLTFISDFFGRKLALLIGAASAFLFCLLTVSGIFYGFIALVLAGSIVAGFCSRILPIALAVVGDVSKPERKIIDMGYLQFFVSAGASIGPVLGGYFAQRFFFKELNFSMPYLIGMMAAIVTIIFSFKYFNESCNGIERKKIDWKRLLNPKVIKISIILIFTQISWRIYYLFVPPILKIRFNCTVTTIGLFLGFMALCLAFASILGVRWMNNYLSPAKIIKSLCFVEFCGLLLAIIGSIFYLKILLWISAMLVPISDVIIFCVLAALYSEGVSEHDQGKIMGWCLMITSAVWSCTGFIGGLLAGININLPIICAPLSLIVLFYCFTKTKILV